MAYDRDSFLAGLTVGRTLWRPPSQIGDIDTGLGWTANAGWLVYRAGTNLGGNNFTSSYIKGFDGWAICIWVQRAENNGLPILASTIYNAAVVSPGPVRTLIDAAGHTWYVGTGYGEQGAGINSGNLPVYVPGNIYFPWNEGDINIIEQLAQVRWRDEV